MATRVVGLAALGPHGTVASSQPSPGAGAAPAPGATSRCRSARGDVRDLPVGQLFELAQHDDLAEFGRQRGDQAVEAAAPVGGADQRVSGSSPGSQFVVARCSASSAASSSGRRSRWRGFLARHEAGVAHDLQQPGRADWRRESPRNSQARAASLPAPRPRRRLRSRISQRARL